MNQCKNKRLRFTTASKSRFLIVYKTDCNVEFWMIIQLNYLAKAASISGSN